MYFSWGSLLRLLLTFHLYFNFMFHVTAGICRGDGMHIYLFLSFHFTISA
jgi:hypothetical protein